MNRLTQLENHKWVVAVYTYILGDEYVPIVIVKNDKKRKNMPVEGLKRIIILTLDEVHDSHDVFALQFVHMQANANLVYWEDMLHQIKVDDGHLRRHLELLLRQMIIDRRELELVHNTSIGAYERKSVHDRLGIWLAKLIWVSHHDVWTYLDKKLSTTLTQEDDIDAMYSNYLKLLDYVDSLDVQKKSKKKNNRKSSKKTKKSKK